MTISNVEASGTISVSFRWGDFVETYQKCFDTLDAQWKDFTISNVQASGTIRVSFRWGDY